MNTKKLSLIVLSVLMALVLSAFVACTGEKPDEGGYGAGAEVGSYYCVVDGAEATLSISEDGSATLVLGGETLNGPCQKDEANPNKIAIAFGESVDLVAEALYANNAITFLFRTKEYKFLRDVNYTVMFDTKGGSNIAPLSIRNGKTAAKPVDPVLEGKVFLGWYKDEACTEAYQFGAEVVTRDITLYALYGDAEEGEFNVSYDLNYAGQEATTQKTVKGVAELPTTPVRDGYEFLGWYVSAYEDADKLTYKYDGQVLYENTTLYAVWKQKSVDFIAVSVIGNQITWNSIGAGTYNVYIYDGENEVVETMSVSGTSCEYDFASCNAGDYRVEVTQRGKTGVSYYKNKALAKISLFNIVNGAALTFNSVPNATEYRITIDCGNPYHKHTLLSNGTSTTYNFANCDMQKGGIKFTVTAVADGYVSSVSETFVFEQGLDKVENLKVNADGTVTWDAVENATSYAVTVKTADGEKVYYLGNNSFSVVDYGVGEMNIGVVAVADKYYSQEATTLSYNKSTMAAPTNVRINETTLVWDAVEGATYTVKISGKEYSAKTNSLELKESYFSGNDYSVSVMATKGGVSSLYSTPVDISKASKLTDDMLTYENGKVYWPNIFGATKYRVSVNGTPKIVNADEHSYALDFIASGEYTVSVAAIGNNIDSSAATINVSVYSVSFESDEGTTVPVMYVAKGDQIVLPESIKGGYDFVGWYNTLGGANTNGKEYHNGQFNYSTDLTMYASWTPKAYTVTLNWKDGDQELSTTQQVYYREGYKLQVPQIEANGYAFSGWYMGSIKYTDENGKSIVDYDRISDATLSASFVQVLEFELAEDGNSYSVKKADSISIVTEVTVPQYYQGKPVKSINGSAFESCSKLVTMNIPDTIDYIFIGIEGIDATGSAFKYCSSLAAINVYETETTEGEKGGFWSEDGVLYYNNPMTNVVELYVYPKARTGNLVIADGVEKISQYAIKSAKVNTVTIPTSVKSIEKNAFASNSSLTKIEFEEVEDGAEYSELEIADEAFYSCSNLLEITLPSRIKEFRSSIFRTCSKLASVYFSNNDGKYYSDNDGIVYTKDEQNVVTLVFYPLGRGGDYTVPNGVNRIGDYAFTQRFVSTSATSGYTYTGNTNLTSITIPAWVTYIGEGAFRGATKVTKVDFRSNENGSLEIGAKAFYGLTNTDFTTLTLPAQLVSLGESAFGGCTKLVTVNLDSHDCSKFATDAFGSEAATPVYYVTTLNIGAETKSIEIAGVFGTKLATVNIDENNQYYVTLDDRVVYDKDVTTVMFVPGDITGEYVTPDTVTTIGANAFAKRTGLTKVTIGKNVTNIGDQAFYNCTGLLEVAFETGREKDLTIGEGAFKSCSALTSVTLPETTVSVGDSLFNSCSKLETVNLPASLKNIEYGFNSSIKKDIFNMFTGSSTYVLKAVNVAEGNEKYASKDGILYEKDKEGNLATLLYCPCAITGSVTVPSSVTLIADMAFSYSKAEVVVFNEIDEDATLEFGERVFYVSEIQRVELPKGLSEISDYMFWYCDTLVTVVIPNTVTRIGEYAFYLCTSLEELTIPNSVTSIAKRAFSSTRNLKTLIFEEGNNEKDEAGEYKYPLVFEDGTSGNGVFGYDTPVEELVFPERTTHIGSYLTSYYSYMSSVSANSTLKKVVIPSTIESIGTMAFYGCTALEVVEFRGDGISALKDNGSTAALYNTFGSCKALKTVINLPESSAEEGYSLYSAFSSADLESVEIPASVSSMTSAFNYNYNLKSVTFKEGSKLKTLKQSFSGCKYLTSVALPDGLEELGSSAFSGLTSLATITIPKTVKTIGASAFSGCSSLSEIKFDTYTEGENAGKSDLKQIDYKAFEKTAIAEFTFPESTAGDITLGGGTTNTSNLGRLFNATLNLTKVSLSNTISNIEYVFKDAPYLKTIEIKDDNPYFKAVDGEPYIYNTDKTAILFVFGTLPAGKYEIKAGVTEIAAYAFEGQNTITEVVIPYTVEKLGMGAFTKCLELTKVTFENTPEHPSALKAAQIGESLFDGCNKLQTVELPTATGFTQITSKMFQNAGITSIVVPNTVTKIGTYAFSNCTNLKTVTFAEGSKLTTLDNYAFNLSGIESISIPSSVKTIGTYVFYGATSLKEVEFLKDSSDKTSLTSIGNYAFAGPATGGTSIESIEIPASVTTLGTYVFSYCRSLKSVTFEEGTKLSSVGNYVFQYSGIETITIPSGVTKLSQYMFRGAENLTEVKFAEDCKITSIGSYAFVDAVSLKSFVIPDGVAKIDIQTFVNCQSLESVTIPETVTEIGNYAFLACANLKSISIPDSVTKFGMYCFSGCTALEEVKFSESSKLSTFGTYMFADYAGTSAPKYPSDACTSLKTFEVPASVKALATGMFRSCTGLETVTFAEGSVLNFLGTYTFRYSGLKEITVPKGVTMLGTGATTCSATGAAYTFADCVNLTKVEFLGKITKIGGYVFYGCTSLDMDIPANVTVVGTFAFANTAATSYTIPKGLTTVSNLGNAAFAYNKNLKEFKIASGNKKFTVDETTQALLDTSGTLYCVPAGVEIPNGSVTVPSGVTIKNYAFAGCNNVKTVTLPDDMTEIPNYAFAGCTGLESITIPKGVTKLGTGYAAGYVFDGCTNLSSVTILGDLELVGGYAFRNCTSLESIDLPESVNNIGYAAFYGSGIKEFTIKSGVTLNGSTGESYGLFAHSALEKVTFDSDTLTEVKAYTFYDCKNLKEVVFTENSSKLTTMGNYVFSQSGLESVTIPATLTKIGTNMFADCELLSEVKFEDGLTALGNYMFKNCTALKAVTLPETLTFIGQYSFMGSGLESVKIPNSVLYLGANATSVPSGYSVISGAFKECTSLKSVTLPEGLIFLGGYTFMGCTSLEEIVIPETVTRIGSYAFSGCTALKKVNIPENVEQLGTYVFEDCNALESVVVPAKVTYVGTYAFKHWTENQTVYFKGASAVSSGWAATWASDCNANVVWEYQG